MAGEIAQEVAVMLALSSAAIGASGAVISQVVAGAITGKRERGKADVEADRWKAEADAKRRDRQMDRKIALFSEFLSTMREFSASDVWLRETKITSEMTEDQRQLVTKLGRAAEEIGILAPELYEYAEAAYRAADYAAIGHVLRGHLQGKGGQEAGADAAGITKLRESVSTSIWLFRNATRSYVSHEPITRHSKALAEYEKSFQDVLAKL